MLQTLKLQVMITGWLWGAVLLYVAIAIGGGILVAGTIFLIRECRRDYRAQSDELPQAPSASAAPSQEMMPVSTVAGDPTMLHAGLKYWASALPSSGTTTVSRC